MPGVYVSERDGSRSARPVKARNTEIIIPAPVPPPEPTPGSWSGWGGEITSLPHTYIATLSVE